MAYSGRGALVVLLVAVGLATSAWRLGDMWDNVRAQAVVAALPSLIETELPAKETVLIAHYRQNPAPLWLRDDGLNDRGAAALEALAQASIHGIPPARYGVDGLREQVRNAAALPSDAQAQAWAELELRISRAMLAYCRDLALGATKPRLVDLAKLIDRPQEETLWKGLLAADSEALDVYIQGLAPQSPRYAALQKALADYSALAEKGGWPAFPVGKKIELDAYDARIPTLRSILTLLGDAPPSAATATEQEITHYDAALQQAVKRFQARHGLNADGVIGAGTQTALAVPVHTRIKQQMVSLERMRWLPPTLGEAYVLVNLPAYTLEAVRADREPLRMRVIIGKSDNPTPRFANVISQIVVNPAWHVPHRIGAQEILPKLQEDPEFLARSGFSLSERDGESVDAAAIDFSQYTAEDFPYRLRQAPGGGNALGKVKFYLPNSNAIYLHDTSRPQLFAKEMRSLSHGCVRIEQPQALVQFLLQDHPEWDAERVKKLYASSQSRTVPVTPMPTFLVYWTAMVDEEGAPQFFTDPYNEDAPVFAALSKPVL